MDANQLRLVAWVALGGALGSVARYGISGVLTRGPFPWGTFVVNLTGSFLLALLFFVALGRGYLSTDVRTFLFIGVFGGYTTFSTFGLETTELLRSGPAWMGLVNIALNGGGCVLAALVGAALGQMFGGA